MKKIITIILILLGTIANAQQIKISNIDGGGASSSNGTLNMVYTIGEVATQEITTGIFHISEGFISPKIFNTVGIDEYNKLAGVTLFPNPTAEFLTIHFENVSEYDISVFDLYGKLIQNKKTDEPITVLQLSQLPSGIYRVLIKDDESKTSVGYKISKQ